MNTKRNSLLGAVAVLLLAPSLATASPAGVVRESGRTAGHAVRDSVQTVGRTIGAFFVHGPRTAKHTWRANAARTKADAHADKAAVVREAREER